MHFVQPPHVVTHRNETSERLVKLSIVKSMRFLVKPDAAMCKHLLKIAKSFFPGHANYVL